mgnify:CR=1 FL=1
MTDPENPNIPRAVPRFPRYEVGFLLLGGIFLVSLVVANLMASKLFVLFGVVMVAGVIPYPVTFLATDLVCEVYGQRRANTLVFIGFILSFYVMLILQLGLAATPVAQGDPWYACYGSLNECMQCLENMRECFKSEQFKQIANDRQHEFEIVFGGTIRAIIASMIAYLIAQLVDVRMFHYWKRRTNGEHLWLRNNASTVVSQLVDTVLVVLILFLGVLPTNQIIALIAASYCFKLLIALVDTPFFYFGTRYLKIIVSEERQWPERAEMIAEISLAVMCLSNIGLVIWAGSIAADAGAMSTYAGQAFLVIGIAAANHLLCTVALAQPKMRRDCGILMLVLTTIVVFTIRYEVPNRTIGLLLCVALLVGSLINTLQQSAGENEAE